MAQQAAKTAAGTDTAEHPFVDPGPEAGPETQEYEVHAELVTVYRGKVQASSVQDAALQVEALVNAGGKNLDVVDSRIRNTASNKVAGPAKTDSE